MIPDGSYIIIHLVEPKEEGRTFRRTRLGWPLHITLVPWFTSLDDAKMTVALAALARKQPAFTVTVGEEALFGSEQDVAVSLVATTAPCEALHRALVDMLRSQNVVFASERYMEAEYRPHVTHHGERRRRSGDIETVNDITLVRLLDQQTCEVVRHFKLGAGNEAAA